MDSRSCISLEMTLVDIIQMNDGMNSQYVHIEVLWTQLCIFRIVGDLLVAHAVYTRRTGLLPMD